MEAKPGAQELLAFPQPVASPTAVVTGFPLVVPVGFEAGGRGRLIGVKPIVW